MTVTTPGAGKDSEMAMMPTMQVQTTTHPKRKTYLPPTHYPFTTLPVFTLLKPAFSCFPPLLPLFQLGPSFPLKSCNKLANSVPLTDFLSIRCSGLRVYNLNSL